MPIGKYIEQGNAYRLSAWFPDNLEVSILGNTNDCCSKNQAKEIMQAFFDANKPYKFEIVHKTDESLMKHAIGRLYCTNNNYSVTISVLIGENGNHIQILRIGSTVIKKLLKFLTIIRKTTPDLLYLQQSVDAT